MKRVLIFLLLSVFAASCSPLAPLPGPQQVLYAVADLGNRRHKYQYAAGSTNFDRSRTN